MARPRSISDDRVLEAAREVFVEQGFGASTREVARRAGISEGVLFQRYDTKVELFFAAMEPPAFIWDEVIGPDIPEDDGLARLRALVAGLVEYFRAAMPVLLPLLSHPEFRMEDFARRHPDSSLITLRREIRDHLAAERRAGRVGPIDPGPAALALVSLGHSIAFFERLGAHDGSLPDALVRGAVEAIWEGLEPAAGAGATD